jgi:hypothetical protein
MAALNVTSTTTGILLSDTTSNPVSIAAGIYVGSTSYAIGSATPFYWTIVNSGTLQSGGTSSLSDGLILETGSADTTTAIGQVTNTQTGTIAGYEAGVAILGAGTVVNQGTITASATAGGALYYNSTTASYISLSGGVLVDDGSVSNAASAVISGYYAGVAVGDGGSVVNAGTIEGTSTANGFGIVLAQGGVVTNAPGGTISAGVDAVLSFAGPLSVYNQGLITAGYGGVGVGAGGTITNAGSGVITGQSWGIKFFGPGASDVSNAAGGTITGGRFGLDAASTTPMTVVNSGIVTGSTVAGVYLFGGGSISNAANATITGGRYGLYTQGDTTLTNAGTISGVAAVGVVIIAAGSISNAGSGVITGGADAIFTGGTTYSVITNDGLLIGTSGVGVFLISGGTVTNDSTATILGHSYGVRFNNDAGTVYNTGTITSTSGTAGGGVLLDAGGYVSNQQGGTIAGQYFGVVVRADPATVVNAGSILSHQTFYGAAVQLADGGSVTNSQGGYIRAQWIGVQIGTTKSVSVAGTVVNQGTIFATDGTNGAAIWITGPAEITNAASGTITGGPFGIVAYNQITVVNQGSIGGSEYGLDAIGAGYADRVIATPGATFSGIFSGGNTLGSAIYSTLELASGSSAGSIANVGSFVDFGQIALDAGAGWSLGGTIAAGETVTFGGPQASLTLLSPTAAFGTMSGFATTDTIILSGITATSGLSFSGDTLVVSESSGPNIDLLFDAPVNVTFSVTGGSTDITVACFAQGTRVETATGAVAVEALRPGTQVRSVFGGNREVVWIGHRHIDCTKHPRPRTVWPIQIEADAFGPGLPLAALRVSPDHAIYVNQVLIPARHLVNGTTIRQVPVDEVTYYHVELPRHDVLLAEGLPAESYLDIGDRSNFSGSMPVGLFPDFSTPAANLAAVWETEGCAPLVIHGAELEAARRMVNARAVTAA